MSARQRGATPAAVSNTLHSIANITRRTVLRVLNLTHWEAGIVVYAVRSGLVQVPHEPRIGETGPIDGTPEALHTCRTAATVIRRIKFRDKTSGKD